MQTYIVVSVIMRSVVMLSVILLSAVEPSFNVVIKYYLNLNANNIIHCKLNLPNKKGWGKGWVSRNNITES